MSNYSVRLNLQAFKNAGLVTIPGRTAKKRCICIPVDDNPEIFVGEKGVYLNLTAVEMKEPRQYGDTHFLKGNVPEKVYKSLSDEERKSQPIVGQMRPLVRKEQPAPEVSAVQAEVEDDLPF